MNGFELVAGQKLKVNVMSESTGSGGDSAAEREQ